MTNLIGLRGEASVLVTGQNTAAAAGSGSLQVFGTPFLIALMEEAACRAIHPFLEEGQSSVGIHLDVSHDAATPVGMTVRAEAEVTAVEGRILTFRVTASDACGPIGQGTHRRCIIRQASFLERTYAKKQP